jgi:hypothetical protein
MEQYSYTSTHPLGHTGSVTGTLYFSFIHIMGTTKLKQLILGNKEYTQNMKGCLLGSGHLEE